MTEDKVLSFDDECITPEEFIELMFERTDEDGVLYIPWTRYRGAMPEQVSCRCKMDWNLYDYERILKEYTELVKCLEEIASHYDELGDDPRENRRVLGSERLLTVWEMLKPFEAEDFDIERVRDIEDRMDQLYDVVELSAKLAEGETLDEYEKYLLKEGIDVKVSAEEKAYVEQYREYLFKQIEQRVGKNICSYTYLLRCQRLCKLYSLKAPRLIIEIEKRELACAMVLHRYGISKEDVDDSIRHYIERLELMSEEELDELSRPKKTNSRKSMAPLYVYCILQKHSSSNKHLKQQDILKILANYPYEITLERKALSRILHNMLDDSQLSVLSDNTGVWYYGPKI